MSRIKDVDVAEEATQYARYQILVQSGTSMLAQANAIQKPFYNFWHNAISTTISININKANEGMH